MKLEKYSMGIGDRFGHQGAAQLKAFAIAADEGIEIAPVWNKSFREHQIIGTQPGDQLAAAKAGVEQFGWTKNYYVDADHISMANVDLFIEHCNFFTLDVADYVGKAAEKAEIKVAADKLAHLVANHNIKGLSEPLVIDATALQSVLEKYLFAINKAAELYKHIVDKKGLGNFITEVSMDETDIAQSPADLLVILALIADAGIDAATIAPKFTGRFNKGVDYVGDVSQFAQEFYSDVAVVQYAIANFDMNENLKLSVHSGSDKFAIYPYIREAIRKFDTGLHLKTAGTTWLEEVTGLALSGAEGLAMAKEIYAQALAKCDELCKPYATVIDIDRSALPSVDEVNSWDGQRFARSLRHNQEDEFYNLNMRQLVHIGYKVAAQMGQVYLDALRANKAIVANEVSTNIYQRHIKRVF